MNITINLEVGYEDNSDLFAWLDAGINGVPVKVKRTRNPRKPMTDEQKVAFRARMEKGQEEAAKRRKDEEEKKSEATSVKKPATKLAAKK